MWRIFVPLRYLQISHSEKWKFDLGLPIILAALFTAPLLMPELRSDDQGMHALIEETRKFLALLTGFFIASLAAVATFGKAEMDEPMPGRSGAILLHKVANEEYEEPLSRRRFLSFLFGYLAFVTLVTYLASGLFLSFDKYLVSKIFEAHRIGLFCTFWAVHSFLVGNVISNTLLGLFYLTDRIHRPNNTLRRKPADADSSSDHASRSTASGR